MDEEHSITPLDEPETDKVDTCIHSLAKRWRSLLMMNIKSYKRPTFELDQIWRNFQRAKTRTQNLVSRYRFLNPVAITTVAVVITLLNVTGVGGPSRIRIVDFTGFLPAVGGRGLSTFTSSQNVSKPTSLGTQGRNLTAYKIKQREKMVAQQEKFADYYLSKGRTKKNKCSHKSLPRVIIIGVTKCGSGALRAFLNEHPQVSMEMSMPGVKYFSDNYVKGLNWYMEKMPCSLPSQITVEQTPQYFNDELVPERIREFNSSIKLIAILRDPTSRVISQYLQMLWMRPKQLGRSGSFENSVFDYKRMEIKENYAIEKSKFVTSVQRWLEFFPLEQLHIVDGVAFAKDPVAELKLLEKFLGIEDFFRPEHFPYSEKRGLHCIQRKRKVHCLGEGKGRPHPKIDPLVLMGLRDYFRPYNEQLFQIIGRRFDTWG